MRTEKEVSFFVLPRFLRLETTTSDISKNGRSQAKDYICIACVHIASKVFVRVQAVIGREMSCARKEDCNTGAPTFGLAHWEPA